MEKPRDQFAVRLANRDGLYSYCRLCESARVRAHRTANLDRVRATEAARDLARAFDPKRLAYLKEYRARPKTQAQRKVWLKTPIARATRQRLHAARRARKKDQFVEHVDPLILLELDDGMCGLCGEDVDPLSFHIDHIVPLSRGGLHAYRNCQPTHPTCNLSKKGEMPW